MNRSQLGKKDLDWANLGFSYRKTDFRFSASFKGGAWQKGELISDEVMSMHEGSPVLHYGQACFEGLKAQSTKDGRVLLFRPELNCERLIQSAERLLMPAVPEALFMEGVMATIKANQPWIPPYGSGASLYIRPFLIGTGENLGLRPAPEYEFRVFCCPVGPYYGGQGLNTYSFAVTDVDRAAPLGTGGFKVGANYGGGLLATKKAQQKGANEALYLDAATRTYLEEAGSANIVLHLKGDRFVTPASPSILPSVTRRSIMTLASDQLGLKTEERKVDFVAEFDDVLEMGACGTAAVLSPIGKVLIEDKWYSIGGEKVGPVMTDLYTRLTQLQVGDREDPYGWTKEVEL